jgi:anti-sigma28 factor (negative regulator of flagellin synthesis)
VNGIDPYAVGLPNSASSPATKAPTNAGRPSTDASTGAVAATHTDPISSSATTNEVATAGSDSVQLSEKGQIAQSLLDGAASAATSPNPAVPDIARQIAAGSYHPTSQAIAEAMIGYETMIRQNDT